MTSELRRGDVVLIAFPFVARGQLDRKRRPAVVIQADKYNRRRSALIVAAITSAAAHRALPCKVTVTRNSAAGQQAGLKLDSIVDCQTIVTIPREEITARLGAFPPEVMRQVDQGIHDALGLTS